MKKYFPFSLLLFAVLSTTAMTTIPTALAQTPTLTEDDIKRYVLPEVEQRQRMLESAYKHQLNFQDSRADILNNHGSINQDNSIAQPNWLDNHQHTDCFIIKNIRLVLSEIKDGSLNNNALNTNAHFNHVGLDTFRSILFPLIDYEKPTYALERCVNDHNLSLIVDIAQNELLKLGYLTSSIMLPEQDISSGELILAIQTGKIHQIFVDGQAGNKLSNKNFIHQAFAIKPNQTLRLKTLEQGLDNLKKIDNSTQIQIVPATDNSKIGFSDLLVTINKSQNASVDIALDNSLSSAYRHYLARLSITANNLMHLNDEWSLSANYPLARLIDVLQNDLKPHLGKDRQLNYQAGLSFNHGMYKFGITHGNHEYQQFIAGFHAPLNYHGNSTTTTVHINRLLSRNNAHKLEAYFKAYHKNSQHFIDDVEIEVQKRRTTGWQAGINHQHYFADGANLYANLDYKQGTGALGAQSAPEEEIYDAFGQRLPAEGYAKAPIWSWYIRYQKPMLLQSDNFARPIHLMHTIKSQGQYAKRLPIAQERFYLGGRDNMKGIKEGTYLSARHGVGISYELAYQLPYQSKNHISHLYGNFDQGVVLGEGSYSKNRYLSSGALGLRHYYQTQHGIHIYTDVFIGRAITTPAFIQKQTAIGVSIAMGF